MAILNKKNELFEQFLSNGKLQSDYDRLQYIRSNLVFKKKFHVCLSAELFDPSILAKTYWSILKTFVDVKLVPFISSLLVNGKFVTDFLEKANIFNDLFSQQCQPIFDIGN